MVLSMGKNRSLLPQYAKDKFQKIKALNFTVKILNFRTTNGKCVCGLRIGKDFLNRIKSTNYKETNS